MIEVDLSRDLLPQHDDVLRCLGLLGRTIGTDHWCLVGGMMVLVATRISGRADSRGEQTKDGDDLPDVVMRVPTLTGALCVKASAALDPRTTAHPRHIQDVAFLLACVADPREAAGSLDQSDRALLALLHQSRLSDSADLAWAPLQPDDRDRAVAALDFLTIP